MLKTVRFIAAAMLAAGAPVAAQIQTVDPNRAMAPYGQPQQSPPPSGAPGDWGTTAPGQGATSDDPYGAYGDPYGDQGDAYGTQNDAYGNQSDPYRQGDPYNQRDPYDRGDPYNQRDRSGVAPDGRYDGNSSRRSVMQREATVPRDDVFNAAEGVFGRGAEGLASLLERILREQGEPTAYIAGSEAGGAFVFGVRYGSGILHHQIEGDRTVYWTGPSLGFDAGADANKVFVLVYNLHDTQDLFKRFAAGEGHAYFVGGFSAQYMRHGDIVLIPIRLGVGLRLGINAGYMRFSERNRWLPF